MSGFNSTFAYKLIYIFRINDNAHKGLLKVGEATCFTDSPIETLTPNCRELNQAAKNRINQYTTTAGIVYDLLYTELAIRTVVKNGKTKVEAFSDHDVHKVFERSNIKKHVFDTQNRANEWFSTDLETAKNAIWAVKKGRNSLLSNEISTGHDPIVFRPEQLKAIKDTKSQFRTGDRMLWNAKMRFGKTLTALQVAKEMEFSKTIILTHRPVVSDGWYEDFNKIFYDTDYVYGSKTKGEKIEDLIDTDKKFVYFASMQDLRGSQAVGGKFDKNDEIFLIDWDYVVIDEAHEGTLTKIGQAVIDEICNQTTKPKVLRLSGTPFNLLDQFKESEIYTWDYVMEQREKHNWDKLHLGDNNPYASLPELQIYTYDLNKLIHGYFDEEDNAFNFREFFRTWTGVMEKDFKHIPEGQKVGDFVHERDVNAFLNLLCKKDNESNYPFSTDEYRDYFRHSLWMVPGVKEAKALSALLSKHPVFGNKQFWKIVNVAGDGDEEVESKDALKAVRNAFGNNPSETYTITISCGRLTTGVSVPEWTAVFMLAGTFSTAASAYLQTIFRVQTPANINGKVKEYCCVFDFAPDRTLKMVAEAGKLSAKSGNVSNDRVKMGEFLNFCPVIGIEGSKMSKYSVDGLLQQLKKAYTDRVVKNGFDDPHIYNDNLLKLDGLELKEFEDLKAIIGTSKQTKPQGDIDVNRQGLTDEQYEELGILEKKPKKELSEEDKKRLEELKEKKKNKDTAISILRGISIRIPLLVYGADVADNVEITAQNFTNLIDDISWEEFMPKGVTKEVFNKFAKYYEQDVFIAAGRQIRNKAKAADKLSPTERVYKIAEIFDTFRNPDKETVLTPWRVVNMHLGNTLGGYDFYNNLHEELLNEPRFVDLGKITKDTLGNINAQILEINSKSGLYPLYVVYSIYRKRCSLINPDELTFEKQLELWDKTVKENIFVICKTPMARTITKRTLVGYRNVRINAHAFDDLIMQFKDKPEQFREKILRGNFWDKGVNEMKFDAIVGNPPYQEEVKDWKSETNGQARRANIFPYFQICADKLSSGYVSLIYPGGRWIHRSGKGMADFGLKQINDTRLSKLIYYPDSNEIFREVSISDGISIVLKDMHKTTCEFEYSYNNKNITTKVNLKSPKEELIPLNPSNNNIVNKVTEFVIKSNISFLHDKVLSQKLFGIESDFIEKNYKNVKKYEVGYQLNSNEVKVLTNDKAGPAGRSTWFVIDKDLIKCNQHYIDEWQVVVSSAHPGGQEGRDNQISIVDNHSAFGRARVALNSFKTELEAKNFYNYCKTNLIRFMFLMTDEALTSLGKKVPDIGDYSNNNRFIDFSKDLNEQLYKLIGLTPAEIEFIEKTVK